MPPLPPNAFLWSHTRHETFTTCLRRYYYAFYAAWGGWLPSAPPDRRLAYTLKRLLSRADWIGDRIVFALSDLLHSPPPSPDALPDAADRLAARKLELLRNEFAQSRNGLYLADPAHAVALFDHYYRTPLSPETWRDTVNRLPLALARFSRSTLAASLLALPRSAILSLNRPVNVVIDGLPVRAHPHLAVADSPSVVHLYHWETDPAVPLSSLRDRLLVHALVLSLSLPSPPETFLATAYSPFLDASVDFSFAPADLAQARAAVQDSADEMLFPLADPSTNDPGDGSAFEPTPPPPPSTCLSCPFRQICPHSPPLPS